MKEMRDITLDDILTGLRCYSLKSINATTKEYYAYYPELKGAKEQVKALFAKTMSKAWLALENDEKDAYIYRDVLSTMIDEM